MLISCSWKHYLKINTEGSFQISLQKQQKKITCSFIQTELLKRKETKLSHNSILLLRMALSGFFVAAGINHLQEPEKLAQRMAAIPYQKMLLFIGPFETQIIISGSLLLFFGLLFLLGVFPRWSAPVLLILLICITLSIQIYEGILFGTLWNNISLMGGLLFFLINKHLTYQLYPKYKKMEKKV